MANNGYDVGELVTVDNNPGFQTSDGTLTDPTTVTLTVGMQGAVATVYTFGSGSEITRTSAGLFTANVDTTNWVPGVYWYQWRGVGTLQAVASNWFLLNAAKVKGP